MSDAVVFNPEEFAELFPAIKASPMQEAMFFKMAEGFLDNTRCSIVKDLEERKILLYTLTAHIAQLNSNVEGGNAVVGRIASATEGSVSISLDYGTMGNNERWYLQTPYGANYWQMTKKYRSFLYRLGKSQMSVNRKYAK